MTMKLAACAKINLMLDILGTTDDGYHTLFMIMQSVSIEDFVTITETGKKGTITLSCSNAKLPSDSSNIGYKAAARFFEMTGIDNPGIHIDIEKHIPFAAGLAGGSADAAAVYVGLNRLTGANLSTKELCEIALKTGADVPFCIQGGTMCATDIGGVLAPLPDINHKWFVLVKPSQDVSTKEAYDAFDRSDNIRHLDTTGMLRAMVTKNDDAIYSRVGNVFEQFIYVEDRVTIKSVMRRNNAIAHCMSGSGPTVFGVFDNKKDACSCYEELKSLGFDSSFVCEPQNNGVRFIED